MDYLTTLAAAGTHLGQDDLGPQDPIMRAALDLAVRPWLDGIHTGADAMRWGEFATTVQSAAGSLWPGPPGAVFAAEPAIAGPELNAGVRALLAAAVAVFARAAATPGEPLAWEYSAVAAQLRAAEKHLP